MTKSLQKHAPSTGHDQADATQLKELHTAAQNGLRRVMALGLFCFAVKERLPHGQFGAWLESNCPEISVSSLKAHMQLTMSVLETCGFPTLKEFEKASTLAISKSSELLLLTDAEVKKPELQEIRQKIFDVIDGKSARQLMLEFKSVKEAEDGTLTTHVGRRPGEGGREAAPTTDITEMLKFQREFALRKMGKVDDELSRLYVYFLSQPDDVLTAWVSGLERVAKVANRWLNTTPAKRDAREMEKLWRSL